MDNGFIMLSRKFFNPAEILSGEFELKFKIDAATFINYYSSIFTQAALSRITGIIERIRRRFGEE